MTPLQRPKRPDRNFSYLCCLSNTKKKRKRFGRKMRKGQSGCRRIVRTTCFATFLSHAAYFSFFSGYNISLSLAHNSLATVWQVILGQPFHVQLRVICPAPLYCGVGNGPLQANHNVTEHVPVPFFHQSSALLKRQSGV